MIPWVFWTSAVLLALERVAYAAIWHRPDAFERVWRGLAPHRDPVAGVAWVFAVAKLLQALVFGGWCLTHGDGLRRASDSPAPLAIGALLIVAGQTLNLSVFARIGRAGVFYGNRLHREVAWCDGFPFSWFRHPQYLGTVLSIWGFFLVMRYPEGDWLALPLLETAYYALGAWVERSPDVAPLRPARASRATSAGPSSPGRPR